MGITNVKPDPDKEKPTPVTETETEPETTDQVASETSEEQPEKKPELTQEQVNEIVKKRLQEERARLSKKYGDLEALMAKASSAEGSQKEVEDLKTQLAQFRLETLQMRIASEKGLPLSLAASLVGITEAELAAHADKVMEEVKAFAATLQKPQPPPSQATSGPKTTIQGSGSGGSLTEAEKQVAAGFGMTKQEYDEAKKLASGG